MSGKDLDAFIQEHIDPSYTLDRLMDLLPAIDFKPEESNIALIHVKEDFKDLIGSDDHEREFINGLKTTLLILPVVSVDTKINFMLYKILYYYYTYGLTRHKTFITQNPKYAYYKLDIVIPMNAYLQKVVENMSKEFKDSTPLSI